MKLNIAYPASGAQKIVEIDDELKLKPFYEKRMAQEVTLDHLGDEFKGYIARISGGNDKQGFPMKQGVLTHDRVRLLLKKGQSCYRPRRAGGRFRKSVRGCVVDGNLAVLNLVIVKKGEGDLPGITDKTVPRRLGPKRANNIRKFFNLSKDDDVRQYVVRRPLKEKEGKPARTKAPKIQRLITPERLQRKRREKRLKILRSEKSKREEATFLKLMAQRNKEERAAKEEARRRRSSASHGGSRTSTSSVESEPVKVVKKGAAKKGVPAKKDDKKKAVSGKDAKKAAPAVASKDSKKKAQSKSAAAPAKAPAKPAKKVEVKGKKSKGGKK